MFIKTSVVLEIGIFWNNFLMLWCVWCDLQFLNHEEGSVSMLWLGVEKLSLKLIDLYEMLVYELYDDMWLCEGEGNSSLNITLMHKYPSTYARNHR